MADITRERPLYGDWHHGNGVLVCGTIRIASMDFDTSPSDKVKTEIFDWICERLNASPPVATQSQEKVDAERYRTVRKFIGAYKQSPGFRYRFQLQHLNPAEGADLFKGSVAQHFDEAIDAAIKANP